MIKRNQYDQASVDVLEETLERMLRPVRPDPQFVDRLHRRLVTPPTFTIERQSRGIGLLIVALGLFFGMLTLLTARWLFRLLSSRDTASG